MPRTADRAGDNHSGNAHGLDGHAPDMRPCTPASDDDRPLTVSVQVRIAVGGHADAVAAAQGVALRGLLAALASNTRHHPASHIGHDERRQ